MGKLCLACLAYFLDYKNRQIFNTPRNKTDACAYGVGCSYLMCGCLAIPYSRIGYRLEEPVEGTSKWKHYKDYYYTLNISFTNDFDDW